MPFVSDTFTESSDVALESHTGETGATWTVHSSYTSKLRILAANDELQTKATGTGSTAYYASGTPASAEYDVEQDVVFLSTSSDEVDLGVTGRMSTSANTFYHARHARNSNVWQLYKFVAGSATLLDSYVQALTTSQVYSLKLEIRDAAKKLYVDSVERCSSADDVITATGKAGVRWNFGSANRFNARGDNFVATDVAAAPGGPPAGSLSLMGVGI
jgi:hypothetical protein